MTEFLGAAALAILLLVCLGLARIIWGPGEADRLMAVQLLGSGGVAVLVLLGVATKTSSIVDVALMLALLAAFALVAFVVNAAAPSDQTKEMERP